MTKYRKYLTKRRGMTDEELLFENLRLNKVLDHAFWRDVGPSDWKRKGGLTSRSDLALHGKKPRAAQWWLQYADKGLSRPATGMTGISGKTGKTGSEIDYSIPAAPLPPYVSPVGHHPQSHRPFHHRDDNTGRVPAPATRRKGMLEEDDEDEVKEDEKHETMQHHTILLAGSPRRSQFTPNTRSHHALAPPMHSPRHTPKQVFCLPNQTPRDSLRSPAHNAAYVLASRPEAQAVWTRVKHERVKHERVQHHNQGPLEKGIFESPVVQLLPAIAVPATPLGVCVC
jgi:hypothetical protein